MRKKLLIAGLLLIIISVAAVILYQYKLSPEYNYITAKLDVKNGNARLINVGMLTPLNEKEVEVISAKYGFKNVYISGEITKDKLTGINNYNEVIEAYLNVRNGFNWKINYKREIDSLNKPGTIQENKR